jgi:hypothetical protein
VTGATIGQEIAAARLSADLYKELDRLVRQRVPASEWPEQVRAIAGDMIAFYSDGDDPGDC